MTPSPFLVCDKPHYTHTDLRNIKPWAYLSWGHSRPRARHQLMQNVEHEDAGGRLFRQPPLSQGGKSLQGEAAPTLSGDGYYSPPFSSSCNLCCIYVERIDGV